MPRPFKPRRVNELPRFTYFKPTGIPMRSLEEIILTVDEIEALRLKDLENLEQHECASRMGIAQSTLQRILVSARSKVSKALIEGKALRVRGGSFTLPDQAVCPRCHERERGRGAGPPARAGCPVCDSN